jgi:hypothetical protein
MRRPGITTPYATASRIAVALDRYRAAVDRAARSSGGAALRALEQEFHLLRLECARLPVANVEWVVLLISHFEVLSLVLPSSGDAPEAGNRPGEAPWRKHRAHIADLAAQCRRWIDGHGRQGGTSGAQDARPQGLPDGRRPWLHG